MAKSAKTTKKTAAKSAAKSVSAEAIAPNVEKYVMKPHPLSGGRKVKQLVTSAPHFKFMQPGDMVAFRPSSKIVPAEGEYAGKLIGWNGVNIDTGEVIMIGNTHQIEKAFMTESETQPGVTLWEAGTSFQLTWLGKSGLGNGKTFNNYDIGVIEGE